MAKKLSPSQITAKKAALAQPANARASTNQATAKRPTNAVVGGAAQSLARTQAGQQASAPNQFDRYSTRGAEANAAQQQADRAANLLRGQSGTIKTYIDPNTGLDTRFVTADGIDTRTLARDNPLYHQQVSAGNLIEQDVTGVQFPSTAGGLRAMEKLSGISQGGVIDNQRQQAGADLRYSESGAMGKVGTTGKSGARGFDGSSLTAGEEEAVNRYAQGLGYASAPTPAEVQQYRNELQQAKIVKGQARMQAQEQANTRLAANAATQMAQNNARTSILGKSNDALISQIQASLPDTPEGKLFGQGIAAMVGAENDLANFSAQAYREQVQSAEEFYDDVNGRLEKQKQRTESSFKDIESSFEKSLERKTKMFAVNQAEELEKNEYLREKQVRDERANLRKQLDQMSITMALFGRSGSIKADNAMEQAAIDGERAIADLTREFGFQERAIRNAYQEKYIAAEDKIVNDWYVAKDKLNTELGRIEGQGIANAQAKQTALQGAFNTFVESYTESKREGARILRDGIKEVRSEMLAEKSELKKDESAAFAEMKWYKEVYGANPPEGVIEDLARRLPNTNVRSFFDTKTADEIEKQAKRTSGSSGGARIKFNPTEYKSGNVEPTQEDYVNKKLAEAGFFNTPDYSAEIAAEEERLGMTMNQQERERFVASRDAGREELEQLERTKLQAEWSAKKSGAALTDPNDMRDELIDRVSGSDVPQHTRNNAIEQFDSLIRRGEYEKARDYIDGLGKSPVQTERKQYQAARQAKQDVIRIKTVLDKIGEQGPIVGRFREMNPYDDRVVELNNLITSTVPNLARGVFGEVGVLTDVDVARYTNIIANVELTKTQAETATRNLLITIDNNVRAQLDIHRASGLDVRDLESIFFDGASAERNDEAIDEILNSVYQ